MTVPKNKAFLISQILAKDPEKSEEELSKLKVIELTRLLREKSVVVEKIEEPTEEDELVSFVQRLGCA
jgi:hypothetical protein